MLPLGPLRKKSPDARRPRLPGQLERANQFLAKIDDEAGGLVGATLQPGFAPMEERLRLDHVLGLCHDAGRKLSVHQGGGGVIPGIREQSELI